MENVQSESFPSEIPNWVSGRQVGAAKGEFFDKLNDLTRGEAETKVV